MRRVALRRDEIERRALEARRARRPGRRPRAAAGRGRSSGSGSRRGGRRTQRHRDTASRSGCSTSSRRRAGATGARPRVVEAVDDAVAERADLRVVAVQDEHRLGRELVDGDAPALGDQLELAVAVELVAEEVAEANGTRAHAPEHLRERRLVHLEEARARHPGPRGGWRRPRRRGSRPSGCAPAGSAGAGSRRPSRRSSSCRSSPR